AEARPGVQAVTVFGGFPISDLAETGLSIVSVADTPELARAVAQELGREAWRRRAEYVYAEEPLPQSIARAAALANGSAPVLLLDHGDNCMSGGSCDVMDVLEELLAAGHEGIMVGPIADPETVARLVAAGEGAAVEIALGNKTPAEGLPAPRPPLRLTGRVTALSNGRYRVAGPIYNGQEL
ncbi:MlrC C-terminal domain-containing protein, partial [Paracoccus sp. PXZ]